MIIDAHTHFYDPTRPEGVPWPPKENALLYRPTLPDRFKALAEPLGVTGTVVVEASPRIDDNQWILNLAKEEPMIVGFVGKLHLEMEHLEAYLKRFTRDPLFRGIRAHASDLGSRGAVKALRLLERADLSLDLHVNAESLPNAVRAAAAFPKLRIVLNHTAQARINGEPPDDLWLERIKAAAQQENVYCKASALAETAAQQPAPAEAEYYRPVLDALWELFGERRLIYGSNWPVCELGADYETVFQIVDSYFSEKGERARQRYFAENARAAYKWSDRQSLNRSAQ